ncbi:MAG: DUF4157 domain-containing protein [Flexilinea sp.]|nr:DUF4157 domain-containing protein [Flexilinea sp.]
MSVFAEEEKKKEKNAKSAVQAKETVQRDLSDVNGPEGGMLPESVSAKIQSKRGTGQRLSDRNLQQYSQKFGRDMSDVHVHTDAESDTISRSLNARAFTIGSDVFLTKGIDPDGSGRDAQTMAHELTHVVQQGGHAGGGRLKLGAADTAQEHEAESTAQREYSPELEEEEGTIQRGFFGSLGSMIGHNFLGMVGLEDAYNATYGAKHKVQAAVSQLDGEKAEEFRLGEAKVSQFEQMLATVQSQMRSASDEAEIQSLQREYSAVSQDLSDARQKQLEMVQTVDESISDADMVQYRNRKSGKSMVMGALGSSIMSGFAKSGNKEKAGAAGLASGASYGAGISAYTAAPKKDEAKGDAAKIAALQKELQELKIQMAAMKMMSAQSVQNNNNVKPNNSK